MSMKYYVVTLIKIIDEGITKLAEWALGKDQVLDIVIDLGTYTKSIVE